ncbi:MAG: hypothetical protein U1E65_01630 [Myxococcota bacterium]
MNRTAQTAATLLLLSGCGGGGRYVAEENWTTKPDLRVVLVALRDERRVFAVPEDAPLSLSLPNDFGAGNDGQVWVFGYSRAALSAAFPGLQGRTTSEMATLLQPSFDPGGSALPAAAEVLRTDLGPKSGSPLRYAAVGFSAYLDAVDRGALSAPTLHLDASVLCSAISSQRLDSPSGVHFDQVAAIDDDRAILAASAWPRDAQAPVRLYGVNGGQLSELTALPATGTVSSPITWDPITNVGYAVAHDSLYAFDASGSPRIAPSAPPGRTIFREVSAGRDGSLFALIIGAHGPSVFFLRPGGFDEVFTSIAAHGVELLYAVGAERAIAYTNCAGHILGPSGWEQGIQDPGCPTDPEGRRLTIRRFAGDADTLIAVGNGGTVALVTEGVPPLLAVPEAQGHSLLAAAGLTRGRALVAGDGGTLLVRAYGVWCSVDLSAGLRVNAASAAVSGETAYVLAGPPAGAGADTTWPTAVVRVRVPLAR